MSRREHGWVYTGVDRDGVDLYVGQHDGPDPGTRTRRHEKADAEWFRHCDDLNYHRTHRDDLSVEEEARIKAANDGQGTVFNYLLNGQTTVPRQEDYIDRYYDGYSDRYGNEQPNYRLARDRAARAEGNSSFLSRKKRRRQER